MDHLCAFQSLIGRLKTVYKEAILRAPIPFQSLIGRLKTRLRLDGGWTGNGISIPYR